MRTRRQFQPIVSGVPYRLAPSGLLVASHVSLIASHAVPATHAISATHAGSVAHDDTDMPETGTPTPIILAPPPTGTVVC